MLSYFHRSLIIKPRQKIYRFFNGEAQVSLGQKILPHEIVGSNWKKPGFRVFKLSDILGVEPNDAENFLLKPAGSRLIKGEIVAKRKTFLGLADVIFRSPIDGIIREYNNKTGQLFVDFPTQMVRIASGVEGEVVEIIPKRRVAILSSAVIVKGRLGIGFRREGIIKVLSSPDIPILPSAISDNLTGKIVVAGSKVSREVLYKLTSVGAKGLITGGIEWQDFSGIKGLRGGMEDVGITILVLGGFGNFAIDENIFSVFKKFDGSLGIISGLWKKILLPFHGSLKLDDFSKETLPKAILGSVIQPKVNDKVRILSLSNFGANGMIEKILDKEIILDSGISARVATVRLDNNELLDIPLNNLEVVG